MLLLLLTANMTFAGLWDVKHGKGYASFILAVAVPVAIFVLIILSVHFGWRTV